jgi:hypothetical protein
VTLPHATVYFNADANQLYVGGKVNDRSPMINWRDGDRIWNGDALELAFSTSRAPDGRTLMLSGDQHIGIKLGTTTEVYDWMNDTTLKCTCKTRLINDTSFAFECAVPWSELHSKPWAAPGRYGLEVALDRADSLSRRVSVERWNSSARDGFAFDPSLWGVVDIPSKLIP